MTKSLNKVSGGEQQESKTSMNGEYSSTSSTKSCKGNKCNSTKLSSKDTCSGIDCMDLLVRGDMFPFY